MRLESAMLTAKTIRIAGRPARAIAEHGRLIESIAKKDAAAAEQVIRAHILSALARNCQSNRLRAPRLHRTAGL
jgi:DNA-binding GntR family transcriptional regulator